MIQMIPPIIKYIRLIGGYTVCIINVHTCIKKKFFVIDAFNFTVSVFIIDFNASFIAINIIILILCWGRVSGLKNPAVVA